MQTVELHARLGIHSDPIADPLVSASRSPHSGPPGAVTHPGIHSVVKKTASAPRKSGGRRASGSAVPAPGRRPLSLVGVGASAGALEAFKHLLQQLPTDTGMAFILVQHLDPHRESLLVDILARQTEMPVLEATDASRVEPDHVYVTRPDRNLGVLHGQLQLLKPPAEEGRMRLPVDFMLCSLAREAGAAAIGIVLSGTASDGTQGLRAIKAAGGLTFAQDAPLDAVRIEDFILPEDLDFVHQTVLPTVLNAGRWLGDFRFRHLRTGEPIDVHWNMVRIDDPETGRPLRLATVTRDVRVEKSAERALHEGQSAQGRVPHRAWPRAAQPHVPRSQRGGHTAHAQDQR